MIFTKEMEENLTAFMRRSPEEVKRVHDGAHEIIRKEMAEQEVKKRGLNPASDKDVKRLKRALAKIERDKNIGICSFNAREMFDWLRKEEWHFGDSKRAYIRERYGESLERGAKKQRKRLKVAKVKCMEYLGGACKVCGLGYDGKNGAAFEFHHREPKEKKFLISTHYLDEWDSLVSELNKCDLLCACCHNMIHSEEF